MIRTRTLAVHLVLLPLALLLLVPMAWMFLSAFTPNPLLQDTPPHISWSNLALDNYQRLLERAPYIARWVWNTVYISITITAIQLLLACLGGYVFARMRFRGRGALFALLIASMMLPYQALVIPLYIVIGPWARRLLGVDLIDSHWAVILPGLVSPLGIFLMRQYISTLPGDLSDAARIDGCSEFAIWWRVILPLCKPVLAAWGILIFTWQWKNFFWPFIVLGTEKLFTLEVGLATLQQQNVTDHGLVMAGATISAVPMILVFLLFQRQIVRGLTFGTLKG